MLEHQLGPSAAPPLGSLDAAAMADAVLAEVDPDGARELLTLLAALYRWLAETEQLEPRRARAIASRFAAAAVGDVRGWGRTSVA